MKSILTKILDAVKDTDFPKTTYTDKAVRLCEVIFNNFIMTGGDFHIYRSLSAEYLRHAIRRDEDRAIILKTLKSVGILLCDESYISQVNSNNKKKVGKAKGYKFNPKLIDPESTFQVVNPPKAEKVKDESKTSGTNFFVDINNDSQFNFSSNSIQYISNLNKSLYHICFPFFETFIHQGFQRVSFKPEVYDFIQNFRLPKEKIKVDSEITDPYITLVVDCENSKHTPDYAIKLAHSQGLNLIQYKENCYIDTPENFLERKTSDLKIIYRKSIFDIENGLIRVNRNDTNRRLDYNLTNMKSDLLQFLLIDGEEVVELDISNCQFAILNYLFEGELDQNFSKWVCEGTLYKNISEHLNITVEEAKTLMFRVAFDKVKGEQDPLRKIFPKTMNLVDAYKKKKGYKQLSILLQNMESSIIIDGLFHKLAQKDFIFFTIHDAIRVKKSDCGSILKEVEDFFKTINFTCHLRNKEPKKLVKIKYKGFKEVEIEEITKEDIKLFLKEIENLETNYYGASEELLLQRKIFDPHKTSYLYEKWVKRLPIIEE